LFDVNGKLIGVRTVAEAEAMAKKENYLLSRKTDETDFKYKNLILIDPKRSLDKKKSIVKGSRELKKVTLGANIENHDIITKAKQIKKFLASGQDVQVLVFGQTTKERLEEIYTEFEKLFKKLRFVQKVVKANNLKFTILHDSDKISEIDIQDPDSANASVKDDEFIFDPNDLINDPELEKLIDEKLKKNK
jgi:translation initiation factor IF-3